MSVGPSASSVSRTELFLGFFEIGVLGFGGVLPWARRILVEKRGWLTDAELTELLSMGQMLPGPNVTNVSIMLGARYHGPIGSVIAVCGLMSAPFVIVLALATLHDRYLDVAAIRGPIRGVGAVAAGLVLSTALKLAMALPKRWWVAVLAALTFGAVAVWSVPLVFVLLALAPVAVFIAWRSAP